MFSDPFALSIPDDEHSTNEERWASVGKDLAGKTLLVVHTYRRDNLIRLISARKATASEQSIYLKRAKK